MKRVIASKMYSNYETVYYGNRSFGLHIDEYDPESEPDMFIMPRFSLSEIHPYDDADYTWAKRDDSMADRVIYVRSGKIVDRMTLWEYNVDDYENAGDYVNDVLNSVCVELLAMNSTVRPVMVHN